MPHQPKTYKRYSFTSISCKEIWKQFLPFYFCPTFFFLFLFAFFQTNTASAQKETAQKELLKRYETSLRFQENKGQWDNNTVLFRANNQQASFQFTPKGVSIGVLEKEAETAKPAKNPKKKRDKRESVKRDRAQQSRTGFVWNLNFLDKNLKTKISGKHADTGKINYITGDKSKNISNTKSYQEVWYESVYNDIDARFYSNGEEQLEYDFIVHPGAQVSDIHLEMEGIKELSLNQDGEIVFQTPLGELKKGKPYTYQKINGQEIEIASRYVLEADNSIRFEVGDYDPNHELVIDPIVLAYSTYLGGLSGTTDIDVVSMTVDNDGNVIVVGFTGSYNLPVTPGTIQASPGAQSFIIKFDPTLSTVIWGTYFSGSSDFAYLDIYDVGVDAMNNVYIGGRLRVNDLSPSPNPGTPGAWQENPLSYDGGFAAKLTADGTSLAYFTYITADDTAVSPFTDVSIMEIDVDVAGNLVAVGSVDGASFPTSPGVVQPSFQDGGGDWVVVSLNNTGGLNFSTYLGGTDWEYNQSANIEIGPGGNIYVSGSTYAWDYPTTAGVFGHTATSPGASVERGVLSVLNPTGTAFVYSTYINDPSLIADFEALVVHDMKVDPSGNAYMTGLSYPGAGGFSFTSGAFSELQYQGFLVKMDATGQRIFSTALSDIPSESAEGINLDLDDENNIYIFGRAPGGGGFTATVDGLNQSSPHSWDGFLLKLSADGSTKLYGTDIITDDAIYWWENDHLIVEDCKLYLASSTNSVHTNVTPDAFQTTYAPTVGSYKDNGFISIFDLAAKSAEANMVSPATQTVCSNGRTQVITGTDLIYQGSDYIKNGVIYQQIVEVSCQWQASNDGLVWEDIPGAIGNDFLPAPTTTDVYFRRICGSTACDIDISNVHSVIVGPDVAPTVDPGTVNTCAGIPIQIGALAAGGTGGSYTYSWLPTIGLDDPNIAQPTATVTDGGIYNIVVTDDGNGCEFEEQWQVNIVQADAGPDAFSCGGLNPVAIGTKGNPSFTYSWAVISGDPISSLSNPNIPRPLASPSVITTYELTVTVPEAGCSTKDTVIVDNLFVTINAGVDTTLCMGEDLVLGETAEAGYTYGWAPGVYISSQTSAQPTFKSIHCFEDDIYPQTNNPIEYTVTKIHDVSGCKVVDTVLIYLLQTQMDDICGVPTTIGIQEDSCGLDLPGVNFTWSVTSGDATSIVGQENDRYPLVNPSSNTNYNLDVELNGKTCSSAMIVNLDCTCSVDIEVDSDISCPIGGSYNTLLTGTVGMTGASDGNLPAGYHYEWSPTFGLTTPTELITEVGTIPQDTTYYLSIIDESDGSTLCFDSIRVYASLAADPFVGLNVPDFVCAGTPTAIGVPGVVGWSYEWMPVEGLSNPYISNPVATINSNTTYTLTASDAVTGCVIDAAVEVVVASPIINAGPDRLFCENAIVTLGTPAIPGQTYSWEPAIGLAQPNIAQPLDTLFIDVQFELTVTDILTGCSAVDTVNYTLSSPPIIDAGADVEVCAGGSGTLIGPASQAGYTYIWSPTDGLSDPTIAQPLANPSSTTTYTLLAANGNPGCYASDEVIVTVGSAYSLVLDDAETCATDSVNIGVADAGGTYSWTPTTGLGNPNSAQTNALPAATTTYVLTWVTPDGCSISDEMTVTILPVPTASTANLIICEGERILIGDLAEVGVTYAWISVSGDPVATLSATDIAQPTATPTQTTVYRVTASRPSGCSVQADVTVTVEDNPVVDLGVDYTICGVDTLEATIAGVAMPGSTHSAGFEDLSLNGWTQDATDDFDWTRHTGSTPTTVTGPAGASEGDYYIYIESNGPLTNDTTRLISPSFVLDALTTSVSFDWMMYGPNNRHIGLDISDDGGSTWTSLWVRTGTSGQAWTTQTVDISAYVGSTVQFRLVGVRGSGGRSDAAFDNFLLPGKVYSYSWNTLDDTPFLPISITEETTYSVTVTSPAGCTATDEITVTPTYEVNVGLDRAICPGISIPIGIADLGAGYTYSWTPTTGLSSSTISDPVATPTATTTYVLTVDDGTGCILTDSTTLTLKTAPTLPSFSPQTVCNGSCASIDITPEAGTTYYWSPATGLNTTTGSSVTACPIINTTYTVTAVSREGCISTTTATINVLPDPPPTVVAGTDQTICSGETVQLGATGTAGITYYWSSPDAEGVTALSNAFINNPTATLINASGTPLVRTFIVEAVDDASLCSSLDTVLITVNTYPVITVKTIPEFCLGGGTLNLSSTYISYSGNNLKYTWSPAANVSDTAAKYPILTVTESTNFTLIVEDTLTGCATVANLALNVSTESLTVDAGIDQTVCVNDPTTIGTTPLVPPLGADHSVYWDDGLNDWTQATDDNFEWTRKFRYATTTGSTGPSGPVSNWYYMYTEADGRAIGDSARIVSPAIAVNAATSDMSFNYHMYGAEMGAMKLDVSTDGGTSWTTLWSLSGDQGDQWTKQIVDISAYAGMTVNFSFVGVLGGSQTSDMAIDDVSIPGTGPTNAWFFKSATSASYTTSTFYYINGTTRFDVQPQIKTDHVARSGTYRVEVTSENGCIATDEVEIVVRNEAIAIDAGTNQFICGGTTATMSAINTTGVETWTQESGPNTATIVDINAANTQISGLTAGVYVFKWAVSNVCNPGVDYVTIEMVDAPNLVTNAVFSCGAADLTAATVTTGSSNLGNLTYWVDTMATIQLARPDSVTTSGVYYIKTLTTEGCEAIMPVEVTSTITPSFTAFALPPSCTNGIPNNDGYLRISAATDATHYNFIVGSDYTSGDTDIANATAFDPATDLPLQIGTLANPTGSQDYTIRVFNGASDCFTDYTVTMEEQDCTTSCDCTEMLYLNEPGHGTVYKFSVNPSDGDLTSIGNPWYSGSELPFPHGLGVDLNGFLYIGESIGAGTDIRKFTCDGDIFDESDFVFSHGGQYNIDSYDGILYTNDAISVPNGGITAYDPCEEEVLGVLTFCESGTGDFDLDWGLWIDQNTATGYAINTLDLPGGINEHYLHIFNVSDLDLNGDTTCSTAALEITDFPNVGDWDIFGVTTDLDGNIYMVLSEGWPSDATLISKYDANLNHIAFSAIDNDWTDGGYALSAGIVYSATADKIYLASQSEFESCLTSFSTDLTVIEEEVGPSGVSGSFFKGMAIVSECCPSPARQTIDETVCGASIGDKFFLNEIFPCTGVICGAAWTLELGSTGITYDACDQSITINSTAACARFTKQGANDQCGAYDLTFNFEVLNITAPVIAGDAPTCANNNDPAAFTITTPASGSGIITYRWQNSTTDCTTGFTDIGGAPTDATPYDPPVLTQETYYRVITEVSGTCSSGMCVDTSNCVTLTPVAIPTIAANSSNPTTCGGSDGSITLTLTNVPDGVYTINYMDGVPSAQTFTNVSVAVGSAMISGLSAGTYNNLSITVGGCTSTEDVDIVLTETCLYDYGDLPDTSSTTNSSDYQTLGVNNGPRHIIISGLNLGSTVDDETDGQSSNDALGDGVDEDGLTIFASLDLYPNMTFRLPFSYVNTTGNTAHVEAWIDWNDDGAFDGVGEMVADWDDSMTSFLDRLEVAIPPDAKIGSLLGLRIRISNQDNMTPYGEQPNGEVEDYLIGIACPQVCLPIQATIIRQE